MDDTILVELLNCHKCPTKLLINPLYNHSDAKYCPIHGDFFIQRMRNEKPVAIFRGLNEGLAILEHKDLVRYYDIALEAQTKSVKIERRVQNKNVNSGVLVRCDQTGEVFNTIKEAATKLRIPLTSVSRHLRKGVPAIVKGYSFTKLE